LILSAQNLHLGNANVNLLFEHGIISPAYKVYELNECDQYFVQSWVKKDSTKDFFLNATTEGASQCRKNIDWCILNNQLIVIPSLYEQVRIGKLFNSLNHLITLHQSKSFGHILKVIVSCTLSWEQRKLGEIADKVVEKNFQLQERDVFTNSAEFGIIDQKDFFDHEIVNKNNIGRYYIVSPNDFVYNPRISVTAPVGPINRNKLCKRGIMSPLYTVFHPRNMNEIFLEFFFKTNKWHKFMEYNGDSGARSDRFSIKTELFYAMTIPFPSHKEQSKIGICFESLDDLITLHQSKSFGHILKAIFSCTLSWEQRKLGEIVVIERGGSPRPIEKYITESNDGLNWIKIGDAPVQGRYITKTSEKIKKSGLSKTRQVFPGDLILSNSMSFGKPYIMGIEGCIHDGWLVIKNKNNVFDLKFLCHMLSTEYLFNQYKMFVAGSTVNNLNKELVGNASVRFPKMLEQRKIGKHLESLDHLITLHQLEPFQLIFKAIAYRIIDYAKSKPPRCRKYTGFIAFINTMYKNCVYTQYNHLYSLKSYYIKDIILLIKSAYICKIII